MDPVCPPGWRTVQKELAYWSDSSSSTSSTTDDDEGGGLPYGYYKLIQMKRTYTFILEEEELIE